MKNDDIRDRWKSVKGYHDKDDISSIWSDQKKMQSEDLKLQKELEEAKKRARELKKTLYKNKFGDTKKASKSYIDKFIRESKKLFAKLLKLVKQNKKVATALAGGLLLVVVGSIVFNDGDNSTGTLGDSVSEQLVIQEDLPREKPDFSLLYPVGKSQDNYDVVRISPSEAAPSYTYLDRFTEDGQIFRVTQQEIPGNFNLEEAAKGFQATDIIQVDDNKIFHGYSEQGGVQSLMFIKDEKLILVRSPQKFPDDQWAAYYLSLN